MFLSKVEKDIEYPSPVQRILHCSMTLPQNNSTMALTMCSLPNGRVVWFLSTGPWFLTWPQREETTCPSSFSYSEGSMTFKVGIHQASLGNIVSESLSQRKKGKKREEEERGSRLGITCICLAVGACFPLYLSSGSLRVSPYMAPHYGLI